MPTTREKDKATRDCERECNLIFSPVFRQNFGTKQEQKKYDCKDSGRSCCFFDFSCLMRG